MTEIIGNWMFIHRNGDVYRLNLVSYPQPEIDLYTGMPMGARWECTEAAWPLARRIYEPAQ